MKETYYIFSSGRLKREDNTILFEPVSEESESKKRFLPIERIESLCLFGEIDLNTRVLSFLTQNNVPVHVFGYEGWYRGSYYPREYLNSGFLLLKQAETHLKTKKRLYIAQEFINSAAHNILRNLNYYNNREKPLDEQIEQIQDFIPKIMISDEIPELMGIEGNIRQIYYQAWSIIIDNSDFQLRNRVKRPPDTPINAIISFINSLIYTTCLNEIYRTQLNPLISFLHEAGERRFSLCLDLAEIFKPIIGDRLIFKLINKNQLKESHFLKELDSCYLNEEGRKLILREYDEKLKTLIMHPKLKRKVSYRRLIRLECYKLQKHIIGEEEYKALRMWW